MSAGISFFTEGGCGSLLMQDNAEWESKKNEVRKTQICMRAWDENNRLFVVCAWIWSKSDKAEWQDKSKVGGESEKHVVGWKKAEAKGDNRREISVKIMQNNESSLSLDREKKKANK